jgi:hypothetical protein
VRFHCQTPQHDGAPLAVKRSPRHPSLMLPRSKRPILKLEQLHFADDELRSKTQMLHEWAASIAQEGWFVQQYKDERYSPDPRYSARWESTEERNHDYARKDLPYHGAVISLSGRAVDGTDVIESTSLRGTWVPQEGWAATVSGSWRRASADDPYVFDGSATLALVDNRNSVRFDSWHGGTRTISLRQNHAGASRMEGAFQYYLSVSSPRDDKFNLQRDFLKLFESPEQFRDAALADLAALRREARRCLDSLEGVEFADMTHVRGDNPPVEMPAAERPPSDETKNAMLAMMEASISAREEKVRQNYQAMHEALIKAFPADDLAMSLFGE